MAEESEALPKNPDRAEPQAKQDMVPPIEPLGPESHRGESNSNETDQDAKAEICATDSAERSEHQSASDFTLIQLEDALREIISPGNIGAMTRRSAREALERKLQLQSGGLIARKTEINGLLDRFVEEYVKSHQEWEPTKSESHEANDSNGEEKAPKGRAAGSTTSKANSDASAESPGGDSNESSDGSAAQRKRRTSRKRAKPKKRMKQAQSNMMTRAAFLADARIMDVTMGPSLSFQMCPREFSTGSMGWFYGNKVQIMAGDQPVHCQLTVNCAVLGSKGWKDGKLK